MENFVEQTDDYLKRLNDTTDLILKQYEVMLQMLKLIELNTRPRGDKLA